MFLDGVNYDEIAAEAEERAAVETDEPIRCRHGRALVGGWWQSEPVRHDGLSAHPGESLDCDDQKAATAKRAECAAILAREEADSRNRAFDGQVFAVLEAADGGTTGLHDDDSGLLHQVLAYCLARGWVIEDAVYLPATDRDAAGWVTTLAGLAELDRMRDEGEEPAADAICGATGETEDGRPLGPCQQRPHLDGGHSEVIPASDPAERCVRCGEPTEGDIHIRLDGVPFSFGPDNPHHAPVLPGDVDIAAAHAVALADKEEFDERLLDVLDGSVTGSTGFADDDSGSIQRVVEYCLLRGWLEEDTIYLRATDREVPGWVTTEAGRAELDRMRDAAEAERPSGWIEDRAEAQAAALAEYSARAGVALCPRHKQPEIAAGICAVYGRLERCDLRVLVDGYTRRLTQAQLFGDPAKTSECEAAIRELRYHLDADRAPETQSA